MRLSEASQVNGQLHTELSDSKGSQEQLQAELSDAMRSKDDAMQKLGQLTDSVAEVATLKGRISLLEEQKAAMQSQVQEAERASISWRGEFLDMVNRLVPMKVTPGQCTNLTIPVVHEAESLDGFD